MGCGRTAPKPELIRVAVGGGVGEKRAAVLDREGTMPGRGAYLCRDVGAEGPSADCVALAAGRGAIARALRCSVSLPGEIVESVGR